jgi:regulatory protein
MEQEEFKKNLGRMQALCSRSEKCKADIRMKLGRNGIPEKDIVEILDKLQEEGFIDEQRYAGAFVRDKFRLQGWGPVKIANMLKNKRIPDKIITAALREIGDSQVQKILKNCLIKKSGSIKDSDPLKRRAKLTRYALGRGYTYAQIYQALKQLQ